MRAACRVFVVSIAVAGCADSIATNVRYAGQILAGVGAGVAIPSAIVTVEFGFLSLGHDPCEPKVWLCSAPTAVVVGATAFALGALVALVAHHFEGDEHAAAATATQDYQSLIDAQNTAIAEQSAANGAQPEVPIAPRFYCTTSPALGFCSETSDACVRARTLRIATGHEMSACVEQPHVVCFAYHNADLANHVVCAPDATHCEAGRDQLTQRNPTSVVESCKQVP